MVGVMGKVRAAFDVEKVTKNFYERFKTASPFPQVLSGIPDDGDLRWYVSVTLNRLMFVYFIQAKNFLDGDPQYLQNKLAISQKQGKDHFYRQFLCPLFFKGFAVKERTTTNAIAFGGSTAT